MIESVLVIGLAVWLIRLGRQVQNIGKEATDLDDGPTVTFKVSRN